MLGRAALLLALACAVASAAQVKVLHTPSGVNFAESGSVSDVQIGDMLKAAVGVSAPDQPALLGSNLLKRPQATVLINVLGNDGEISSKGSEDAPTYTLTTGKDGAATLRNLLGGSSGIALPAALRATLGHSVASVSASFSSEVADLTATEETHVVSVSSDSIVDNKLTFSASAAAIAEEMTAQVLGNDTRYDAKSKLFIVTVDGRDLLFTSRNPVAFSLISELHMLARTARLAAQSFAANPASPAVFTFTVSRFADLAAAGGDLATVRLLLARLNSYIVSQFATASKCNLLVVAVGVSGSVQTTTPGAAERVEAELRRRGLTSAATVGVSDFPIFPRDRDTMSYCDGFTCFCNRDSTGKPFDPTTNCNAACANDGKIGCECSFYPCSCTSPYVQTTSIVCNHCQKGFFLQNGRCYVDSNYPVMVNIWLWLGLLTLLGLLSTCYVIGDMDPGRNNIIYRMTSQKPKIH